MADSRVDKILKDSDDLFLKRQSLISLWQEIADHFYVERADFIVQRWLGTEFASHLMTGYPLMVRRDLGNAFSSMLRPPGVEWFHNGTTRPDKLDDAGRAWLQWATSVQRRAMYDRVAQFDDATMLADNDFAAFGQAVIQVSLNLRKQALLFKTWHLRDVVWCDDITGAVEAVYRKWKPTLTQLATQFPGKLHPSMQSRVEQDPYGIAHIRHCSLPSDQYEGGKKWRQPRVSLLFDEENRHVIDEAGVWHEEYTIPRWVKVYGSQYACSPATTTALPDARLIQAMTLTLLEVGERSANPPMVATQNVVRSDIQAFAGGVTWVAEDYDEKLGDALRPLTQDRAGFNFGLEMRNDTRDMIRQALYLDKLTMPERTRERMSVFETQQMVEQYIRGALPIFAPMESQYNGKLCENTFWLMFYNGGFGNIRALPETLMDADISFHFESPLHDAIEEAKASKLTQGANLVAQVLPLDPHAGDVVDARTALRDALMGIGLPQTWIKTPEELQALDQQRQQAAAIQGSIAAMQGAANVGKTMGQASQAISSAGQAA